MNIYVLEGGRGGCLVVTNVGAGQGHLYGAVRSDARK
jgi:hypothetical protein